MTTPSTERAFGIKALGPMEVVNEDQGEVTAVVYRLGEVDRDREVVLPDAFASGIPVQLSNYGHSLVLAQQKRTGAPVEPPVGKGVVMIEDGKAVFRGKYFMGTQRGREAFATTKAMGLDQQWSFSFWIDEAMPASEAWKQKGAKTLFSRIVPFEVSPVTVAASHGTQTLSAKQEGGDAPAGDDGADPDEVAAKAAKLADAEAKAAAELAAEQEAAEVAAEDARAAHRAALKQAAAEEFERFQRNLRRFSSR
jgi:hypothetical protein